LKNPQNWWKEFLFSLPLTGLAIWIGIFSLPLIRNKGLLKYLFYEFISNPCAVEKYRNSKDLTLFLKQSVLWYMNYRHLFFEEHLNLPLDNLSKEWGWCKMTWPEYWRDRFVFQKGLVWQKII
jgi:hypothetical protein